MTETTTKKLAVAVALLAEYEENKKPTGEVETIAWADDGVNKLLSTYNDLKNSDAPADEVGKVYARLTELRDVYNDAVKEKHYKDIKGKSDAMMFAIHNPHYRIIKIKHGSKKDNFKELREMADKRIDLLKLNEMCKGSFGAKQSWVAELHKAWLALLARGKLETLSEEVKPEEIQAVKAGKKMSDEKAKQEILGERFSAALKEFEQCDFVKSVDNKYQMGINLLSNGKLEERLVNTVKAMIGDSEETKPYMPRLRDVRYLLKVYAKRSKKKENGIEYIKEKEFADILMDMLRCNVCGIDYEDILPKFK